MFTKVSLRKGNIIFLLISFGLVCLILSCAPATKKGEMVAAPEEQPATIQSINVTSVPSDKQTTIDITSSKLVPYTAFKLVQPLRLIVDITAVPGEGLAGPAVSDDQIITAINFERVKDKPAATRITAALSQDVEYDVQTNEGTISVVLSPKEPEEEAKTEGAAREEQPAAREPRLFFAPGKAKLNQVLGIDYFMLPKGKSRVSVTCSKKADYEVRRKDSLTLLLEIREATIPAELTRYIDSSHFTGAVNRIAPILKVAEKKVDLEIALKEMVPYHVMQTDKEIQLDFSKTTVTPRAKTITPTRLSEGTTVQQTARAVVQAESKPEESTPLKPNRKKYAGERVTLDFANADIRNILKLIGEVSKLNLVWGPEVKGTVSMRLKNVPWDQALDIVLESNELGMRREGNIIWITTKAKIKALEREKQEKLKVAHESVKAAKAAEEEMKAAEPLVTDYITVNYSEVDGIKKLIQENVLGERGKLSVDPATKTIIITDIAENVKKAIALRQRQDRPTKQVMIEARIVEAKTSFSRDMGVRWSGSYQTTRNPWGGAGPDSNRQYNYNFATNFLLPTDTALGFGFTNSAATKVLNAQIAFAEVEGTLRTLSAPKIITRDTVEATIKQGTTIFIPYTDVEGNRTAKEVDATLELKVTPRITPNDMVIMNINVSDDFPDYANRVGEFVPVLTKNASTEMMVASGDTVVIGGIYKESKGLTTDGTPWLRKIPILGWLFKKESTATETSELLIFLTPRVMPVAETS